MSMVIVISHGSDVRLLDDTYTRAVNSLKYSPKDDHSHEYVVDNAISFEKIDFLEVQMHSKVCLQSLTTF